MSKSLEQLHSQIAYHLSRVLMEIGKLKWTDELVPSKQIDPSVIGFQLAEGGGYIGLCTYEHEVCIAGGRNRAGERLDRYVTQNISLTPQQMALGGGSATIGYYLGRRVGQIDVLVKRYFNQLKEKSHETANQ